MPSIGEARKKLPQDFLKELNALFSPGTVDKILQGFCDTRLTTLRVNTLKTDIRALMNLLKQKNIKFERVPWYEHALVIKNATEKEIKTLDAFAEGALYMQSLSSMIPPLLLNPAPGESVLDVTAAPGSKTTQMAMMMDNRGYLLANELDPIRCERLKYNCAVQSADMVEVQCGRGEKLGNMFPQKFDKVLLDAPCSGEGRFEVGNVQSYRSWSLQGVKDLVKVQKKLFASAYKALKPGGMMVYSTCTLNAMENEEIVEWAMTNPEFSLKILPIGLEIREAIDAFSSDTCPMLNRGKRILPSAMTEGFFAVKLQKTE